MRHDLRLLGIPEVKTVGRRNRRCASAGNFARRLGHRVHRTQLRVEIRPASIAVESHGQPAFMPWRACAFNAHYTGFATWALHGVGLHHRVVLLVNPALRANIRAC